MPLRYVPYNFRSNFVEVCSEPHKSRSNGWPWMGSVPLVPILGIWSLHYRLDRRALVQFVLWLPFGSWFISVSERRGSGVVWPSVWSVGSNTMCCMAQLLFLQLQCRNFHSGGLFFRRWTHTVVMFSSIMIALWAEWRTLWCFLFRTRFRDSWIGWGCIE